MTPHEQALRLVIIRVLKDLLKSADDVDREAVDGSWIPGDRLAGALERKPVGWVQLKNGAVNASVTDARAFESWVKTTRTDEWETVTVTRVRPAFQAAVIAAAKKVGKAVTADGEEIPGITVADGDPTVAVTLADNATELVAKAWQSGELWELLGELMPTLEPPAVVESEAS